ncbi:hypothetical protein D3C87_1856680 [compost metagenome]
MQWNDIFFESFQHRLNPFPGQFNFVPMGEEGRIPKHSVVNQVLVSFRRIFGIGGEVHLNWLELTVASCTLRIQLQRNTLHRIDFNGQQVR